MLEAGSAQAAIELLEAESIDLAILDIRMPGTHGLELLSRVHATHPRLPIILCTAFAGFFNEYAVWDARSQIAGMFEKPVDMQALARRVAEALGDAPVASSP